MAAANARHPVSPHARLPAPLEIRAAKTINNLVTIQVAGHGLNSNRFSHASGVISSGQKPLLILRVGNAPCVSERRSINHARMILCQAASERPAMAPEHSKD